MVQQNKSKQMMSLFSFMNKENETNWVAMAVKLN